MNIRFFIASVALSILFAQSTKAQLQTRIGILPSINLNKKLPKQWEINLKTEFRQFILRNTSPDPLDWRYEYTLTDMSLAGARKIGLSGKLVAAYLLRITNTQLFHRSIQQFVWVQKFTGFRIGHRASLDQTFGKNTAPRFRARYRINAEFPLGGQVINNNELYLKINHEYLNELQDGQYDLEIRLAPFIGYNFTDKNKLELGIDYRLNQFLRGSTRQTVFVCLNWYYKL